MTLPVALSGTDVIGQAKTGTGKTLGFGLPLLERVTVPADVEAGRARPEQLTDAPQALVVVPTRELCTQVTNDLLTAGKVRNVRVTAIYGGRAYEPQVEALKKGVDVVVGTPGRLLDLAGQKKLNLKHVRCLVLDEADEMLDLGFLPDVEKIINLLPAKRQTMLFSATMPGAVIGLARRYMSQPTHIRATAPDDEGATVANTAQFVYRAHSMDKPEMVARILQAEGRGLAMIFCRTKRTAADIAEQLQRRGFASGAVHGDLGQGAREQALRAFRAGKVDVLVCTDVAARGIDVEGVTHVINYQSPEEEKTYLHRIGRTGRAGAKGIAITLVDWDDIPRWQLINKALQLNFNDPPETYSTSPHLFEELSIPAGTKGVLPRAERTRAGLDAEEIEDLGETGGRGARSRGGRAPSAERERERERPARTPRRRRRTRNGAPVNETAPAAEATASAPAAEQSAEPATRTPRRRRRTRAGNPAEAAVVSPVTEEATLAGQPVPAAVAEVSAPVTETPAATKPRRRTRRSVEATETPAAEAIAPVTEEAAIDEVVTEAVEAAEPVEVPAKPRRRTRKTAQPAQPAEAAEAAVATAEGTAPEAAPAPRRRTRKAVEAAEAPVAEVAAPAAEAVAAVEADEVPAKPRRRTRKAAQPTEAAEAAVATAEGTAPEAQVAEVPVAEAVDAPAKPRRRTRKAVQLAETAEAAEAAVATAEGEAPVKPKRTRKSAQASVATAESAAADEAPAPRRRTRKATEAAEPAESAVATAEGVVPDADADETSAKPRRRTRKAAVATEAVGTAEAETAEKAPAAPRRRTRKTAEASVAPVDGEAPAAPAKPRRTRKTAEAAVATAEGEAPVRARRTRKTAEAVIPAQMAEVPAAESAEDTEAKPRRRTRKTAAAES
ncbi:DEAD/DEAH box helicase [Streptomyces cavernae]|uniref:DEAD/DEAH box helicase n=1 Tax=Streptomyces cavernae TaxID=2259034 RepID=UPI001EE4869B|nr:DEAD/DEAH box helicase [Streptomyces cavernae]